MCVTASVCACRYTRLNPVILMSASQLKQQLVKDEQKWTRGIFLFPGSLKMMNGLLVC